MKNFKKLIKEAYLGNPLNEDRYLKNQDSYIRVTEPRFRKDKNNPNFLFGYINYDTGPGVSIALGKETMAGQIKRLSSMEAVRRMKAIAVQLEDAFDIEDIEVTDLENGVVELFAVSDDFIDMDPKSELSMVMLEENDEEFSSTEQKMIKQIKSYKKRGSAMVTLPSKTRDFYFKNKEKIDALNEELLKEFTVPGGNYRDSYANRLPEEQLTSPDDYELFMEMFPKGEDSRILMDLNRKKLFDQHLEWTKESQYNNVFQHMQYHDVEYEGEPYRIHQTQYYNTNYKDFRNPRFTELMISKDGKSMGTYLVGTKEYIEDLKNLDVQKRVMEGTCGYGEDGKVDPENTDKLKPAGSKMSDKELHKLVKNKLKRNFLDVAEDRLNRSINEIESGDTVVYNHDDHTVQRIEDDELGVRIYIRPNEKSYYGGRKDTFWVKPTDIETKEEFLDRMMRDQIQHDEETLRRERGLEESVNESYMGNKGDEVMITNTRKPDGDIPGNWVLEKPDGSAMVDMFFDSKEAAKKYAKGKGLKLVPGFKEDIAEIDMNDPVLVKTRASQMKRDKIEADEKAKKSYLDKKYGASHSDKLFAEIDLKNELQNLEKEREDVLMRIEDIGFETEQTAEPEGGKIADKLSRRLTAAEKELRAIDNKIIDVKDELGYFRMYESAEEGDGGAEPNDKELDIESSSDAALDNAVKDMGYNESKGFNFKQMVKEALTPNNLK